MPGAIIEVKYFNTFILKKVVDTGDQVVWNGSFGIPEDIGGYPATLSSTENKPTTWAIEESRVRGGFNNTNVDLGAKAYIVEDEPNGTRRFNAIIYSGIFNSRTGINRTNVFSVAEDITKAADPANGSIQKLYAEDTNLNIFQELKVSRALIDKDAIYAAEGGGTVTASNLVIGVIQPFAGKYGISKNPESFAVYGFRKYFVDANNNVVCRLSSGGAGSGIEEISSFGMKTFFRNELGRLQTSQRGGRVFGGYDIYGKDYVVSIQPKGQGYHTLSFDERSKGWVSFYDYAPDQLFSIANNYYTVKSNSIGDCQIFQHYSDDVSRGNFYGFDFNTSITFVLNPNPTNSKTFSTIGYEGSNGWQVEKFSSDPTGFLDNSGTTIDIAAGVNTNPPYLFSYTQGEYIITQGSGTASAASTTTTINLNSTSVQGIILDGSQVSGIGIFSGTTVVSFEPLTGEAVLSTPANIAQGALILFNSSVNYEDYNTFLTNSQISSSTKYYAGFTLKENKYVSNLKNLSGASKGEILFGNKISGIKGFYATVTMSTDEVTDRGGEKTLFSVESNYIMNNGY